MDGEGILRLSTGERYKGGFKEGKKNGKCIEVAADGTRFEGAYVDGVRDGAFTERDKNGNITRKGEYKNGRITKDNN